MNDLIQPFHTVIHDNYLIVLLSFVVFDVITGTLKAFKNNEVNSKISKSGVTKHITIILFSIFFSWVLIVFNMGEFAKVLTMFYIVSYGLSIFENLSAMGVPFPQWLNDKFKVLQDETNKGVKGGDKK